MTMKQRIILSGICFVIALIFLLVPPQFLSLIYFRLVAIFFVLMGIVKLTFTNLREGKKEFTLNLVEGSLAIILGVIYFHYYEYLVIDIICFISLLIVPILRLIYAPKIINQIGFDFPKYIGLISFLGGYNKLSKAFFIFCGIIWIIILLIIWFFYLRERRKKNGEED